MLDQVFVGREKQLAQLQTALSRASQGRTQISFIGGEAGAGKTTLVDEFTARAERDLPDLLVAFGECNAQTGMTDPYMPFRDVLAALGSDVNARQPRRSTDVARAARLKDMLKVTGGLMKEFAPELLGSLVPGGGVLAKAARIMAERAELGKKLDQKIDAGVSSGALDLKLDQNAILRQYAGLIQAITQRFPLIIVLDDLQWLDASSHALLFHLARQATACRLLIIGLYRPSDVAMGRDGERHPLESTINELKRYYGDVVIDLDAVTRQEGRAFIDALLDQEPNRLGPDFRRALLAKTGGHPLFTVELLRELRERGEVYETPDGWAAAAALDWAVLPAKVEGVVAERMARLGQHERDLLSVASVEGVEFHAEVVARVQKAAERDVLREVSRELDKKRQLVQDAGVEKLARTALSRFRFTHVMFQQYLYGDLSSGERRLLHGDIGEVLEELHGDRAVRIALDLARHFDEAGDDGKAARYWAMAGRNAMSVSAFSEAAAAFERALSADERAPDSARAELLVALGSAREKLGEYADARAHLLDGLGLARSAGLPGLAGQALCELCWVAVKVGDAAEANTRGQAALVEAEAAGDLATRALALRRLGIVARRSGDAALAESRYAESLALYDALNDKEGAIAVLNNMANLLNQRGDLAAAAAHYAQVRDIAVALGNRQFVSLALGNLGELLRRQGDLAGAAAKLEESVRIAREVGDRDLALTNTLNLGEVAEDRGDAAAAEALFRGALAEAEEIGLTPKALLTRIALARLAAATGGAAERDRAIADVEAAINHPARIDEVIEEGNRVLALLRGARGPSR